MSHIRTVHSFDEWSTLREVIVGSVAGYELHHLDVSFALFYFENIYAPLKKRTAVSGGGSQVVGIPPAIVAEAQEDLEELVATLRDFGATVFRPADLAAQGQIASPSWTSRSTPALNVRDQALILGSTILETAPHVRGRIFENDMLKPIFYRYFNAGSAWLSMPRPALANGSLDPSYFEGLGLDVQVALDLDDAQRIAGLGHEIIFDAAQCIRIGRDVLVNVANANHEMGYRWLRQVFGRQFRFHKVYQAADNHIDSVLAPLRPGVMLLRAPGFLAGLPPAMTRWDVIYPPEGSGASFPAYGGDMLYIASRYIDTNVLSLDENTVIVNALYPELVRQLERRRFDVLPVRFRHGRLFGGGFHCVTLDCVRDGGMETYLGE
jgi:glycine amidinotransferase